MCWYRLPARRRCRSLPQGRGTQLLAQQVVESLDEFGDRVVQPDDILEQPDCFELSALRLDDPLREHALYLALLPAFHDAGGLVRGVVVRDESVYPAGGIADGDPLGSIQSFDERQEHRARGRVRVVALRDGAGIWNPGSQGAGDNGFAA